MILMRVYIGPPPPIGTTLPVAVVHIKSNERNAPHAWNVASGGERHRPFGPRRGGYYDMRRRRPPLLGNCCICRRGMRVRVLQHRWYCTKRNPADASIQIAASYPATIQSLNNVSELCRLVFFHWHLP